jgi:hypothetical protein
MYESVVKMPRDPCPVASSYLEAQNEEDHLIRAERRVVNPGAGAYWAYEMSIDLGVNSRIMLALSTGH